MSAYRNFVFTVIAVIIILIAFIIYTLTNIEPNIYWTCGLVILVGLTVTLVFSLIFFVLSKLRSFETPKEQYRRQLKKAAILGVLTMIALLVQKFFDVI